MFKSEKIIVVDGIEIVTTSLDILLICNFIISFVFAFLLYFLPTIIAFIRKSDDKFIIFKLNILLGWTVVGWFIFLIWSFK